MKDPTKTALLLKRTNLNTPFEDTLKDVQSKFTSLGKVNDYFPINEGYEDANFILDTSTGTFVLKIFLSERKLENIYSYVKILTECKNINVPTTEILKDFNQGLGFIENGQVITYYIITKFFEGSNFQNITPNLEDIRAITSYISKINTLNFKIESTYDSWGIKNFAKEYEIKNNKLTSNQKLLIKNNYEDFLKINMSNFSKSVIHGDMQRKHVIKNADGKYCILDFGCMAYDAKVIEIATYLAWFCLQEDTWEDREIINKEVMDIYNSTHHLSEEEIKTLPTLIKASYSAYYMTTSVMINEGDRSKETLDWQNTSKIMLDLSKDWK